MKEKLFLENDNAYFLVQVFHEKINEEFDWIIIKTKDKGQRTNYERKTPNCWIVYNKSKYQL
tara:strand:+ start:334 stop:519 length:186 start_codon:yes stop_codon:yes gene_type:complete